MKKIPSLFVRDYENVITDMRITEVSLLPDGIHGIGASDVKSKKGRYLATEQITPGCEWVMAGEGIATRKWDGTAVMWNGEHWYRRYDAKKGKTPPTGFIPAQEEPDAITGHWPGWVTLSIKNPADRYILEAIKSYVLSYRNELTGDIGIPPGTFEAIGPKIGGNKDGAAFHNLQRHGEYEIPLTKDDLSFLGIKSCFEFLWQMEGFVFHHPDGRMCKVKRSDFGLTW